MASKRNVRKRYKTERVKEFTASADCKKVDRVFGKGKNRYGSKKREKRVREY